MATTDPHAGSERETHEHEWVYGGLRYEVDPYPVAGTSARAVVYHDWFYCSTCLAQHYLNARRVGNTYEKLLEGALPR
jgi:hypothetical protein